MNQGANRTLIAQFSAVSACIGFTLGACTPTVKVEAPDKPIEINMNIHIEQEVRVRVERDLDSTIAQNPDLFGVPGAPK